MFTTSIRHISVVESVFSRFVSIKVYSLTESNIEINKENLLPPATKSGQGNIFRSMCQDFCPWGGSAPLHAGIHPSSRDLR